jgi:hypothetical protein
MEQDLKKIIRAFLFAVVIPFFVYSQQTTRIIKKDTFNVNSLVVDTNYYHAHGLFPIPDSLPDGKWLMTYNNGQIFVKYTIKNKKVVGDAFYYWWNGKLFIKTKFYEGKIDGKRVLYNMKGRKFFEGTWIKGLKDGKFYYYKDSGKLYRVEVYVDDVLMKSINK